MLWFGLTGAGGHAVRALARAGLRQALRRGKRREGPGAPFPRTYRARNTSIQELTNLGLTPLKLG